MRQKPLENTLILMKTYDMTSVGISLPVLYYENPKMKNPESAKVMPCRPVENH
jgi:hypothetical protein